jgi:hypothetical protein
VLYIPTWKHLSAKLWLMIKICKRWKSYFLTC